MIQINLEYIDEEQHETLEAEFETQSEATTAIIKFKNRIEKKIHRGLM